MKTSTNSSTSFFNSLGIVLVSFYRAHISPLIMNNCRYHPSCSQYAITALKEAPFHKALLSICARILRCHPFAKGGYDPFQLKKSGGSCCE